MYNVYFMNSTIKGFKKQVEDQTTTLDVMTGFSKINIFLGSNNSGKSRFLRKMFVDAKNGDSLFFLDSNVKCDVNHLKKQADIIYTNSKISKTCINNLLRYNSDIKEYYDNLTLFIDQFYISENDNSTDLKPYIDTSRLIKNMFLQANNVLEIKKYDPSKNKTIYIPLLRGLRPLLIDQIVPNDKSILLFDLLKMRTQYDYFTEDSNKDNTNHYTKDDLSIFTGQKIYNDLNKHIRGPEKERQIIEKYQDFLKEKIFNNKKVQLIPTYDSDVVTIKIGNENERPIYDLGDGIQSIIILTYPIFMKKDKEAIYFIEEPETNLHPGLQRIFIETLNDKIFDNMQFFITTHSNHLVDMSFDYKNISIYMFEKISSDLSEPVFNIIKSSPKNVELLNTIGVTNSSVFMANCTIWVEGITDVKYVREYIKKEQIKKYGYEKFKEDIHFSFIEYGGSLISHLFISDNTDDNNGINIKNISNRPFVLADFDTNKEKEHDKRKEKLGESYYHLSVKEIENTLHEYILKKVIADYQKCDLTQLEYFNEKTFVQKSYKEKGLGKYIDGNIKNLKYKFSSNYKSGTIKDKINFSEIACKFIRETEEYDKSMSDSAKELTNKLLDFIQCSNKNISSI